MRRLILHGSATSASRKKLFQLKEKFNSDNVLVFEDKTDFKEILVNLQSQSLFDGERLVIIENPPEFFSNYPLTPIPCTLILWFDHEIDTKLWPGFEVLLFPEAKEVSVFLFLDYLVLKDKRAFLEMEKLKTNGFDIHYFITMVFYLLRSLVVTPKNAPEFVRKKIARQRAGFSPADIKNLYKDLIEIDFKIKKGYLEKSQAEFLLLNKFIGVPDQAP